MIHYMTGDPLLTDAPLLAFGWNLRGRAETGALESALMQRYPTAFAAFSKQARQGRIRIGTMWLWRETIPALGFMVVRDTPYGTTRLRHVESIALILARDHKREGIQRLALVLPGQTYDRPIMRAALERWLNAVSLPVMVFEEVRLGVTPM